MASDRAATQPQQEDATQDLPPVLGERRPLGAFDLTFRMVPATDLTDAQEAEAIEFLRLAFNGGPGWFNLPVPQVDHLRWKIREYPYEARAYLIEDDTGLRGFGGRRFGRWLVRGTTRVGRDGVEGGIHPDLQGRGVYQLRHEALKAFDGVEDFTISFGSHPATLHSRQKRGVPEIANTLENLVRPLHIAKYARRRPPPTPAGSRTRIAIEGKRRRLPRPALAGQFVWQARLLRQQLRHRPLRFEPSWSLQTVERFDERIEPFFEHVAREFDLIQLRNERYLNWRYADRRAGPFTIRTAEANGELLGYAVTRAMESGAELADLLVLPGRLDVAQSLVNDSLQIARRAGAPGIRAWMMNHHPYYPLLQGAGFLPIRRIVRPAYEERAITPGELDFLKDPHARIHIMLGDSDHV